jgi:tRNA threonylcarbamoyladenosine biosynthesis protein TsaB
MIVLGIETATKVCGVGLVNGVDIIADYQVHQGSIHAERLAEAVAGILEDTEIDRHELDGIAVSIGPGSFTGLRIGLGLAKGMAYGLDKPLITVPTMEGLACRLDGLSNWICVMIRARKGEIFQGLFHLETDHWVLHEDYQIVPEEKIGSGLPNEEIVFLGDAAVQYRNLIEKRKNKTKFLNPFLSLPSGYGIAMRGHELLVSGQTVDVDSAVPIYMKRFRGVA